MASRQRRAKAAVLKDLNQQLANRAIVARKLQQQHSILVAGGGSARKPSASRIPRPVCENGHHTKKVEPRLVSSYSSRVTYLLKKYGRLWLRAVFGRVSPTEARSHFRARLLSTSLEQWRDAWWESRREWRLMVRAECHDRYRMWRSCWRSWQCFIRLQRIKHAKYSVAVNHADRQLLLLCWSGWRQFKYFSKERAATNQYCTRQANMSRLAWAFRTWLREYRKKLQQKEQDAVAARHFRKSLLQHSWQRWKSLYTVLDQCQKRALTSESHHLTVLASYVFVVWRQYIHHRHQRQEERLFAISEWRRRVLTRMLRCWHAQYRRKQSIAEHEEQVTVMSDLAIKRRLLQRWQLAVVRGKQKRDAWSVATSHYLHHIQSSVFKHWKVFTDRQQSQSLATAAAKTFATRQVLRKFWLRWLCRCECEEEARLVTATHYARAHRNKVLLRQCFQQLVHYTNWRRQRKAAYAKADCHFATKTLPKFFLRLQMYRHIQEHQAHRLRQAAAFRRENLLACHFYMWTSKVDEVSDSRHSSLKASHHYSEVLCGRCFAIWHDRYRQVCQNLVLVSRAVAEDNCRLCAWALDRWRSALAKRRRLNDCHARSVAHYRCSMLRQPFSHWRKFIAIKHQSEERRLFACRYWARVKQKAAFLKWKNQYAMSSVRSQVVNDHRCLKSLERKRSIVQMWHYWTDHRRNCRRLASIAYGHHQQHLLIKTFRLWYTASDRAAEEEAAIQQRVQEYSSTLQKAHQLRVFQEWRMVVANVQMKRWKMKLAADMHTQVSLRRCLDVWKEFHRRSLCKKLCYQQAVCWYAEVLQRKAMNTWRCRMADLAREKQLTIQSMFFWSCCLRLKVFHAWRAYVSYRRQRRRRYDAALVQHQHYLLRTGLVQWLEAGSALVHHRHETLAQRHTQLAVSSLHVVWRCAIHWRQWARRRSLERRSATYAAQPSCVPAGGSSLGAREKRKDATSMPCLNGAVSVAESVQVTAKQDNVTRVARPVVSTRTRLGVDVPPPPAVASSHFDVSTSGLTAVQIFQQMVAERNARTRTVPRLPAFISTTTSVVDSYNTAITSATVATADRVTRASGPGLPSTSDSGVHSHATVRTPGIITSGSSIANRSMAAPDACECPRGMLQPVPTARLAVSAASPPCQDDRVDMITSRIKTTLLTPADFTLPVDTSDSKTAHRPPVVLRRDDLVLMQSAVTQHLERLQKLKSLQDELADLSAAGGEESKHLLSLEAAVTSLEKRIKRDSPRVQKITSLLSSIAPEIPLQRRGE